MLYTTTTNENIRLTKANNINTYTANNDGLTVVSESSHVVAPAKASKRVRANNKPRTAMQRSRDKNRMLDSLFNNFNDRGIGALQCSYMTAHFNKETKSVQVAQNRVKRWLDELPFKVIAWTSIVEYDQYGLTHVHVILKAEPAVLNHGINYLHNALIESFKPYGKAYAERIYDLDGLGRYMLSQTNKAKTVKQAVQDEQQAKENYDTVKGLDVPANIKKRAKKAWRKSHMDKKKSVAKRYEKHSDKILRKSYGQNHGVKVRCVRADVWDFITTHGHYQGSTTTRITTVDELGREHLINVVKRDVYRLNDADTRELQRLLGAIKAYQNANDKAVA